MPINKRFFSPRLLNRFDNWLLLNKPETWSARTHLVIYYGSMFILILAAICFIFPDNPKSDTGAGNWALFTSIITLLALVVWLVYLLRFNVFKRYGNSGPVDRLKTFLLYFIAAGMIMLIPFVEPTVETIRADMAYGDEEIVNDINSINIKITQLEHDSLDNKWGRDTFKVVDTVRGHHLMPVDEDEIATTTITDVETPGVIRVIDSIIFRSKMRNEDSSERVNDSVWVFLSCPDYRWIKAYSADMYTDIDLMTSRDIYDSVVANFRRPDVGATSGELHRLVNKYYYDHNDYYDNDRTLPRRYVDRIPYKYSANKVERSFDNIIDRKYRWCGMSGRMLFNTFFYITLVLSLLVFLFRHSTVKTFFFTLLAICVITILSALILAFGRYDGSGSSFFSLVLFYFIIFAVLSFTAWSSKTRNIVTGIGINLFVAVLPFVPMLITGLYNAIQEEKYRGIPGVNVADHQWDYFYAQILGPLLLLVLLPTYIHKVYRRWYALPED
jgi:hypothetical protein